MDATTVDLQSGTAPGPTDDDNLLENVPGFVWAFRFHPDGTATPLTAHEFALAHHHHEGWLWLHLDLADQRAVRWLRTQKLPQPALDLMLSRDRHQQIHASSAAIYGVFADYVRDLAGAGSDVGHLRFLMSDGLLVSGRHHSLTATEAARNSVRDGLCRLTRVSALLELIIEHVADGIENMADELETDLDRVENELAEHGNVERQKLAVVRRTSMRLHRQLSGLRAAFHRFERYASSNMTPELQVSVARLVPRLDGLDHSIVEIHERGHRLQEELSALLAEQTNRHLLLLTILTAILLPASLVAGIFGMNVKGLPFLEHEAGFIWSMVILVGSSVLVYLVLWRRGMLRLW